MFLFTQENATGLTRTVVTFIYAWLIGQIPGVEDWVASVGVDPVTAQATFVVVVGGLVYQAIRWAAESWGWVGYLLIFNTKPAYPE